MAVTDVEIRESARLAQKAKNRRAIELLRTWVEDGDEDEQRATFEALKEGLNAHQSSGRIIYP